MKKIFLALSLFVSFASFGQNIHTQANNGANIYYALQCGFVGDSLTDNTPALRAFRDNYPDGSTLYFGKGKYLFTDSVTFKDKSITIQGTGMGGELVYSDSLGTIAYPCVLYFNSPTKTFLTFDKGTNNTKPSITFKNIAIINNASSQPTAGSGIIVKGNINSFSCENLRVRRFYIDFDLQATYYWQMNNCRIDWPVKYGIQLNNTIDADLGDWSMIGCIFQSGNFPITGAAGFYWKAGGGGKMVNCKWNSTSYSNLYPGNRFGYCMLADFSGGATSDYTATNCSFENFDTSAVKVTNLSGGLVSHWQMEGVQVSPVDNTGGARAAIDINGIALVGISGVVARNYLGSIAYPVVNLTSVATGYLNNISYADYNKPYSLTTCTGIAVGVMNLNTLTSETRNQVSQNLDFPPYGSNSSFKVGDFELQSLTSGFNVTLGTNMYFNGSNYIRRSAGTVAYVNMNNGGIYIGGAATGSAGSSFTPTNYLSIGTNGALTTNLVTGANTINVGTMGLQTTGTNSSLLSDNMYYNSGYILTNAGYGENLYFGAGEAGFQITSSSGSAGASVTPKFPIRFNATSIGLGGDIQSSALTQASIKISNANIYLNPAVIPAGTSGTDSVLGRRNSDGMMVAFAPLPSVASASYTPALTNTTNISTSALTQAVYTQIGNIVTATISGSFTPTASSTATTLTIALPVTTATTTQSGVGGGTLALNAGALGYTGCYASVNAAGTFQLLSYPTTTTSCNFSITILYHTN